MTALELNERLASVKRLIVVFRGRSHGQTMSRWYDVYYIKNEQLFRITGTVAEICDFSYNDKREALTIRGSGFSGSQVITETLGEKLAGNTKRFNFEQI